MDKLAVTADCVNAFATPQIGTIKVIQTFMAFDIKQMPTQKTHFED